MSRAYPDKKICRGEDWIYIVLYMATLNTKILINVGYNIQSGCVQATTPVKSLIVRNFTKHLGAYVDYSVKEL